MAVPASADRRLSAPALVTSSDDARRFQAWVHRHQFPHDCRRTVGVTTREDYIFRLGLGSQMVALKFNLLHALLNGRVYHFPSSHYVNPLRCPSRNFDCYFQPLTNCSRAPPPPHPNNRTGLAGHRKTLTSRSLHRKLEEEKLLWCFALPRRRLSALAGLQAVYGSDWYHAQLAAFLFRPNAQLLLYREHVASRMEYARERAGRAATQHNRSCAAMHIRRTDKGSEDHRTQERSWTTFSFAFKNWAFWQSGQPPNKVPVLLGSEDKETFTKMPPLLAPAVAYWIPTRFFVMDMSANKQFVNISQANERLLELYGLEEDEYALKRNRLSSRPASASEAPDGKGGAVAEVAALLEHKDEGMALILQILLMADCDAFFGSFSSNVAIIVHDLMLAQATAIGRLPRVHDVNGRLYCGCGAFFCMRLERRAVQEPTRTWKSMVEAFDGDRVWAL